jgi:hypothetical protein
MHREADPANGTVTLFVVFLITFSSSTILVPRGTLTVMLVSSGMVLNTAIFSPHIPQSVETPHFSLTTFRPLLPQAPYIFFTARSNIARSTSQRS